MSDLTEWIKEELYPALFESIDTAFPEHEFNRYPGGWRSKTNIDGYPHSDRIDKTVITKKFPGRILEQGGENLSLIDYAMRKKELTAIQAIEYLALAAGLKIPQRDQFDPEQYKQNQIRGSILEECKSYFNWCMENTKGAEADSVRAYLDSVRGYTPEDIVSMGLGFIPSQQHLIKHLQDKGFSQGAIDEAIKFSAGIGSTHRLTIPYLSGGTLKGFKFRITDSGAQPAGKGPGKYMNSSELDKKGGFFNLLGIRGTKDLIIVEGELDALHATVKGIDNVVATTGNSISPEQVKDAIKKGAKSFTICFDTEPGKEEKTVNSTVSAIDVILAEGIINVYVVTLPDIGNGKTDPDRLIKEKSIASLKSAIAKAIPYYDYWQLQILLKFTKIQEQRDLEQRDIHNLLDEIVEAGSRISAPIHKDRYNKLIIETEGISTLGVTAESLAETIDRLTFTREKAVAVKKLTKNIAKAQDLISQGKTTEAAELLITASKESYSTTKLADYNKNLEPITREGLRERIKSNPDNIKSGFFIGDGNDRTEILIPAEAISILAAPTGHGKTRFLINLALNIARDPFSKGVHFFTFEESSDSILINALNTYQDTKIGNLNNRTQIRSYLKGYALEADTSEIARLKKNEESFFKELIDTRKLNIHSLEYYAEDLVDFIRYLHKTTSIGSVFIDYMQLLNPDPAKNKTYSRQEQVKQVCIALKDLAKETMLPIIIGAQFNRAVKGPYDLHATSIGEAGDIERIASLIVGFYDCDKDKEDYKEADSRKKEGLYGPKLFVNILKNRNGKSGTTGVISYNGNTGKMTNETTGSTGFYQSDKTVGGFSQVFSKE